MAAADQRARYACRLFAMFECATVACTLLQPRIIPAVTVVWQLVACPNAKYCSLSVENS